MLKGYIERCEKYSIIISILMIILSIILIFNPIKSIETLIILFGIILTIDGIISFVSYFTTDKDNRLFSLDLLTGIATIVAGILTIMYRNDLINILPVMIGIWIIFNNLIKLQLSINLSTIISSNWICLLIISILLIILGIVLIVYPFASTVVVTTVVGIIMLISETINLVDSIYILIKLKNV